MRNTQTWWKETKGDDAKLIDWLKDQYHGEVTAADRIIDHLQCYTTDGSKEHRLLTFVADQEKKHAEWVGDLLRSRGFEPAKLIKEERYWDQVLPDINSLEYGAAVAAHAEEMRLERIKAISSDADAPDDIKQTFEKILIDELGHAKIFNMLAGQAKNAAAEQHAKGLEAIGLII